jgi:acetoacetyl-CoA synthetase
MNDPLHKADPVVAAGSQLSDFARFVTRRTGRSFDGYAALHAFSVDDVAHFWSLFLEWSCVAVEGEAEPACSGLGVMETRFFPHLRLSWAENVLAEIGPAEDKAAVVAVDETGSRSVITRHDLRRRVRATAAGLEAIGLREGDRVAAVVRNTLETVIVCLAVTSLGATWSSLPLDMGREAAMARLLPLAPRVLIVHRATQANGITSEVPLEDLLRGLPSVEAVVALDAAPNDTVPPTAPSGARATQTSLERVEAAGRASAFADPGTPWKRFAFDHPLFILFSSGTTGAPKGIVHGHGGTLLEHLKEHRLQCDMRPGDALCFQTSTGWMMWNWTVSALAAGARVVLYDGSVSYPERDSFLRCAAREDVSVLGLSPAYLQYLVDAGLGDSAPAAMQTGLRRILSTGSVLRGTLHRWAKAHLADVPLDSISGGTDMIGCFVMGSPWSDVYEGESGCIGLGLDVRAWAGDGAVREGIGELVCVRPFPSRPVGLLHDDEGARLRATYYEQHPGAWTHGDMIEVTHRGTVRVLGRCDGILNIRGIRIGPSEIYDVIGKAVPEVAQAMAVDADAPQEPGGKRLVLFVVLRRGVTLDRPLTLRIKKELKERASAAHVPAVVVAVDELPATFSNKPSEAALQDALNGRAVRNRSALRNPEAVDKAVAALRAVEGARPTLADRAATEA